MLGHVGASNPLRDRRQAMLVASVAATAAVAAVSVAVWEASPYGRFLHHAVPQDGSDPPLALEAALFTGGWALMIVAMMLPTSLPFLATFAALVRQRPLAGRLVALVAVGYGATWTAFGLAAWLLDRVVHRAVESVPLLDAAPQLVMGTTLLVAGLYQFSSLKYRCLDECRSPLGFVLQRWQGLRPAREAVALGVAHGLFCVGCCWSLMLVMFGLGLGSLAWMLAFGTAMAVEKNLPWGGRLSRALGLALLAGAVWTVAT